MKTSLFKWILVLAALFMVNTLVAWLIRERPPAKATGALPAPAHIDTQPTEAEQPLASEPPTVSEPTAAPVTETTPAPVASNACPTGMREVNGKYCTELEQLCLKGHYTVVVETEVNGETKKVGKRVDVECPNGCAPPKYCDVFKKDSSVCTGEEKPEHFCMDEYEYPNKKGVIPTVMITWYDAKKACAAEGKRLCGDDEWTLACEGPERLPYPTGWVRDPACTIDIPTPFPNEDLLFSSDKATSDAELRRLDHRTPSGSRPKCVSPFGIYDTAGNVDEWTTNRTQPGASERQSPYVSVLKGGHWVANFPRNRCRPSTPGHAPYFYSYAQGFRCCADPSL